MNCPDCGIELTTAGCPNVCRHGTPETLAAWAEYAKQLKAELAAAKRERDEYYDELVRLRAELARANAAIENHRKAASQYSEAVSRENKARRDAEDQLEQATGPLRRLVEWYHGKGPFIDLATICRDAEAWLKGRDQ